VGWRFMPTVDVQLTRLGVFDADRDRLHGEQHLVGIWEEGGATDPLRSVTLDEAVSNIPETSPQGALFHFGDVDPLLLKKDRVYRVGATLYAGLVTAGSGAGAVDFDLFAAMDDAAGNPPVYIDPSIIYLGAAYAITGPTNQLAFPSLTDAPFDYTLGANIDLSPVPVPAAGLLLASGLAGLAGIRRRR
ncbi:MAG: VPLPA-CTERM sorting domain-containing protein, partial [Thermodesulfobacteriota bacterium]